MELHQRQRREAEDSISGGRQIAPAPGTELQEEARDHPLVQNGHKNHQRRMREGSKGAAGRKKNQQEYFEDGIQGQNYHPQFLEKLWDYIFKIDDLVDEYRNIVLNLHANTGDSTH